MSTRELVVRRGDVALAGSLHTPPTKAEATVVMHPGSGPSDRDNDVFFPPIREHLLGAGIAVCSFDKRGVGGSSGRWQEAGIVEQADDLLACLELLRSHPGVRAPIGLFGHSQGGWVVVEAAGRRPEIAFVVASSGPGVTPLEQERFSFRTYLEREGVGGAHLADALGVFDELAAWLNERLPYEDARRRIESERLPAVVRRRDLVIFPEDGELWDFLLRIFDYDPRPALERTRVPVLALFGADDRLVPVEESAARYRASVPPGLLSLVVFPGADHRMALGDPPRLVDSYRETLVHFVLESAARHGS